LAVYLVFLFLLPFISCGLGIYIDHRKGHWKGCDFVVYEQIGCLGCLGYEIGGCEA